MNRNELINHLSYMQDFTAVPQDFFDSMETGRGSKTTRTANSAKYPASKPYNAGNDRRFSRCLEYSSSKEKGNDIFLAYVAFAISANLSIHDMRQPSKAQLSQMFQITGYTPGEMETYAWRANNLSPELVPSPRLRQSVFVLAHALEDVLSDKSEWRRAKRRDGNPSLARLEKLTAYMQENNLLSYTGQLWGKDKSNWYEEFVLHHAAFHVKQECIAYELNHTLALVEERLEKDNRELERAVRRLMKQPRAISAPLANPPEKLADDLLSAMLSDTMQGEEKQRMLECSMATLPPEVQTMYREAEQKRSDLSKSWSRLLENADDMRDGIKSDEEERMRREYMPEVAEDAFQAILEGEDEIFKLRVGRYIWQDFMIQCNFSMPVILFEELEDEYDWDSIGTEANGKLGLKVYSENDLMTIRTESVNGKVDVTMPLSSVLAQYAGRTVPPHLYVRKSFIKLFRQAGYSERKARDFAVVLATFAEVGRIENADYSLERERLFVEEERKVETAADGSEGEIATDGGEEKAAAVNNAAAEEKAGTDTGTVDDGKLEEARRQLKLAQKENQSYRHEISVLQRENEMLQQETEKLRGLLEEKKKIEEPSEKVEEISYPYRTKLKVVVYGGFDVFHRELEKYIPGVRVVPAASRIDTAPIRNADIVFLQINRTDHSGYWTVCDACKNAGVPYIHLNYASAKRCAGVMVDEIKKIEKK